MRVMIRPFETRPGGQTGFWLDWTSRLLFLEGGWGSGKTWIGARKLLAATIFNAIDRGPDGKGKARLTGIESAMVGPTFRSVADFMMPAFEEACAEAGVRYRYSSQNAWYILPSLGTKVRCRTADRPDLITGWQVACAWGDEPSRWKEDRDNPKKDPLLQLMGRVRGPGRLHQIYFTYTNEGDYTRVYEEAHSDKPGRARYRARTRDNKTVADFYDQQSVNLTPILIEQYLEGGAASLGGSHAYAEQFDQMKHILGPRLAGSSLLNVRVPLCLILDFNINPGMHGYIGQYLEAQDVFVIAHELHSPRLSTRQLVTEFEKWIGSVGGWRWPLELQIFGDATAKAGWAGTGETSYDILLQGLELLGIGRKLPGREMIDVRVRVPESNPRVVDRVNSVAVALRDMAGISHVLIHPQCERLIEDIRKVRWDAKAKELDKTNPTLTHGSDAIGYWIHYLRPVRRMIGGDVGGRISV